MSTAAPEVARAHHMFSRDVMQSFYRLLAVALICVVLAVFSDVS